MTRRPIQLVLGTAVLLGVAAAAVLAAASDDRTNRPGFGNNFVMDQYVTVDIEGAPPPPESLARADGHVGRSPSFVDRIKDLLFRRAPIRATRRHVNVEFPATVRLTHPPSTAGHRRGRPPAKATKSVNVTVGCYFFAEDNNGGYWDWTYDARIFDPNNTQIASAMNWVNNKPSYSSSLSVTLTDPDEGTYTCKIKWWVEVYELGEGQATQAVTYLTPTGETTVHDAWSGLIPTAYKWRGRLSGGSFVGRKVKEANGGNDVDTCHWPNSNYAQMSGLSGGEWDVVTNSEYGPDTVGLHWQMVDYYRSQLRAPCQFETDQIMQINRGGSTWASYKTNRIKMGMTTTTVWSYRDGQVVSKNY